MHQQDSVARQRAIREMQSVQCRFKADEPPDWGRIAEVAVMDGVPARYAGARRSEYEEQPEHKPITLALEELMQPTSGKEGLVLYGKGPHWAGKVAGAIYSGAMVRGRGAKWIRFSEMADNFTRKIQMDEQSEWDVGEVRDWHIELDSMKFCYDLLVVDNLTRTGLANTYVGSELWKVLDARAVRGLFTVITAKAADKQRLWEGYEDLFDLVKDQYYKHQEE